MIPPSYLVLKTVITTLPRPAIIKKPKNKMGIRFSNDVQDFLLVLTQITVGNKKLICTAIRPPKSEMTVLMLGNTIEIKQVILRIIAVNT